MSAIHGVEGLIIKGDEWRNDFEAVFDRHVGSACRGAGVALEELADIIGDHGMTVLWGCAFEDFVSSGSGERNVADDYLKRRGWKESDGARAYRAVDAEAPASIASDLRGRLRYISAKPFQRSSPRDALSPFVARQLRDAARADIAAILQRLRKVSRLPVPDFPVSPVDFQRPFPDDAGYRALS